MEMEMTDVQRSLFAMANSASMEDLLDNAQYIIGLSKASPCPWERARAKEFLAALERARSIALNHLWHKPEAD